MFKVNQLLLGICFLIQFSYASDIDPQDSNQSLTITQLPYEVLTSITQHLDLSSFRQLTQTSKYFNTLTKRNENFRAPFKASLQRIFNTQINLERYSEMMDLDHFENANFSILIMHLKKYSKFSLNFISDLILPLKGTSYNPKSKSDLYLVDLTSLGNFDYLKLTKESLTITGAIFTIPSTISNLTQLKNLMITSTNLIRLPQSCENLTNLESLDLSRCNFEFFPIDIRNFTKLKSLSFDEHNLDTAVTLIPSLVSLKSIHIADRKSQGSVDDVITTLKSKKIGGANNLRITYINTTSNTRSLKFCTKFI